LSLNTRLRRVQHDEADSDARHGVELRPVFAVGGQISGARVLVEIGGTRLDRRYGIGNRHVIDLGDVVWSPPTVERIAFEHQLLSRDEVGNRVGPGARQRGADALGRHRQVGRDCAKNAERRPRGEIPGRVRQRDDQLVPVHPNPGRVDCLTRHDGSCTDNVLDVLNPGRVRLRVEDTIDLVREALGSYRLAGREAEAAPNC